MDIETIFLEEFNLIYVVMGETTGPYGDSIWVSKVFRYNKSAVEYLEELKLLLDEYEISEDIYALSHGCLPRDFIDQNAITYHENCGIYYSIREYNIS